MPDKTDQLFDVIRGQDGAIVRSGLDEKTARHERAQLNEQARVNGYRHLGEPVIYELRTREGLIVA
jgi:hypothetical protein